MMKSCMAVFAEGSGPAVVAWILLVDLGISGAIAGLPPRCTLVAPSFQSLGCQGNLILLIAWSELDLRHVQVGGLPPVC